MMLLLSFSPSSSPSSENLNSVTFDLKKEKLSHFKFYWHHILSGRNPISATPPSSAESTSLTTHLPCAQIRHPNWLEEHKAFMRLLLKVKLGFTWPWTLPSLMGNIMEVLSLSWAEIMCLIRLGKCLWLEEVVFSDLLEVMLKQQLVICLLILGMLLLSIMSLLCTIDSAFFFWFNFTLFPKRYGYSYRDLILMRWTFGLVVVYLGHMCP